MTEDYRLPENAEASIVGCILLCAAYDGTPVTIHRSKSGKIVDIEVHDEPVEEEADGG